MKIGAFYQSGFKLVACYKALEQLRKIYPNIPVALYEDNSDILEPVAKKFNCDYKKTDVLGQNLRHSGRPVVGLESNLAWLKRIYDACITTLKDVDWVIHYEDDVWCKMEITKPPKFAIAGANGPLYTPELYQYLKDRFNVTDETRNHWSQLGYNRLDEIDWEKIRELDTRPIEWSDASLSFVFQHAGYTSGIWDDWAQYDTKNKGNWFDKTGWAVPMEEQRDVAFIHLYKHFYNYEPEDINLDL